MNEAHAALPNNFEGLYEACISYHRQSRNLGEESARLRRAQLASFARLFHTECGTLSPAVEKSISRLENGDCIVLMTAHQPNFFAYSGVLRKATLNFVLASKLEAALQVPVVSFFGIADQDFTDDRWVRSCELPSVLRNGGLLTIDVKLPEELMLNKVAKPSRDLLLRWESEVGKWLDDSVRSVARLSRTLGFPDEGLIRRLSVLKENLASFWEITEDCWKRSKKYSEFNGFLMSKIVNGAWGYDTVFARFSECQQAFADDFSFLLSRFDNYSRLLKEAMGFQQGESIVGGVSDQEPYLAPFWYHCGCGSKAKLFMREKDGRLFGSGSCVRCREDYTLDFGLKENPDVSGIASDISARAIPMALVFFNGLHPSCYVGGVGGVGYLAESEHVAEGLGVPFPPIVVWRPRDRYLGIGQAEALLHVKCICKRLGTNDPSAAEDLLSVQISKIRGHLEKLEKCKSGVVKKLEKSLGDGELKRKLREISVEKTRIVKSSNLSVLCHELKILENAFVSLSLVSSVIDYGVNVGLKETSVQWMRYLDENGDFYSDVKLDSVLDSVANLGNFVRFSSGDLTYAWLKH